MYEMLLTWNTLEESANYLSGNTGKNWTEREVLEVCNNLGIFLHIQIVTDRTDVPLWMQQGEMAELPFNLDRLSFLGGNGIVQILRHNGILYKITPGARAELKDLRLSKTRLHELVAEYKQHYCRDGDVDVTQKPEEQKNKSLTSDTHKETRNGKNNKPSEVEESDIQFSKLFPLVKYAALESMFPADGKWRKWTTRAARNGLKEARQAHASFNPYLAAKWWIAKQKPKGWDNEKCLKILARNYPNQTQDYHGLLFPGKE